MKRQKCKPVDLQRPALMLIAPTSDPDFRLNIGASISEPYSLPGGSLVGWHDGQSGTYLYLQQYPTDHARYARIGCVEYMNRSYFALRIHTVKCQVSSKPEEKIVSCQSASFFLGCSKKTKCSLTTPFHETQQRGRRYFFHARHRTGKDSRYASMLVPDTTAECRSAWRPYCFPKVHQPTGSVRRCHLDTILHPQLHFIVTIADILSWLRL